MAFAHDRVAVRLVDPVSGAERAVLPYPDSPNLAAVTVRGAVQVWDLGLDWTDP